jgi:Na+/H+ antiporter NhaD/arsenite permease-like protein
LTAVVVLIFAATYVAVALGEIPGLAIDRTGVALLGAIAMVATGAMSLEQCAQAMDVPTLLLLYSLMVLSSQYRLGGFYTWTGEKILGFRDRPRLLLALLIGLSALLSALLANDIVCLALTPVLCGALVPAGLNPLPYLLALACASNIGSAATLIGNPQNMLIGQVGRLDFGAFLLYCGPPSVLGLALTYGLILRLYRKRLHDVPPHEPHLVNRRDPPPAFNRWQSAKAVGLTVALIGLFFTPVPRDVSALAVAGVLLCSRRMSTRRMLGLVDWHLITLFMALFVVVRAFENTGLPQQAVGRLDQAGLPLHSTLVLGPLSVLLSNLVSNVPAVMLLLGHLPQADPVPWYVLALSSTLAGNLILIGSIANLIVAEQAGLAGIELSFREHARTGIPVTLATLAVAWAWVLVLA